MAWLQFVEARPLKLPRPRADGQPDKELPNADEL